MNVLIDTNILLYLLFDDSQLTKREIDIVTDTENEIIISGISLFEIRKDYYMLSRDSAFDIYKKHGLQLLDVN